jgi:hypothetical protein
MKTRYTMAEAMAAAPDDAQAARQVAGADFGPGLFDRAIAHHAARQLRADVAAGVTRDREGIRARFVSWTPEDLAGHVDRRGAHVWFDFFRGHVLNSCSRMARGLTP